MSVALLLTLALSGQSPTGELPEVVRHPEPQHVVDFSVFAQGGCGEEGGYCNADGALGALGCDRVQQAPPPFGALRPALPIAYCLLEPFRSAGGNERYAQIEREGSVSSGGGRYAVFVRFVVAHDDRFEVLATDEDLEAAFAPIESADEAFAFAWASTGLDVMFGHEPSPQLEYFVDTIEDPHAESAPGGFRVHLFHVERFGCGRKPTSAVELHVSRDGEIEEISRTPMFTSPAATRSASISRRDLRRQGAAAILD